MSIIRQLARVANRIDSASTGTFLSKGDSTGDFTLVDYTDLSGRPTTLDSAALTTIVDSAYIQLRQTSAGSGGLDSAAITALVDSNYVVARSPSASSGFAQYEYTATAGQTTFQDSDINGNVMSYTADGIFVFYNGVLIAPTTDYEATDGSSVVLTTGADSGSHVAISKWSIAGGGSGGGSSVWYGDRGLTSHGQSSANYAGVNNLDYVDITTPGNATDFGDLTQARHYTGATSNSTYGVWAGGYNTSGIRQNTMDYVTIASPSNATDFGDLVTTGNNHSGCSDGTYGLFAGFSTDATAAGVNDIDYITIASPGNASDFGDLTIGVNQPGACADATYGLFAGGFQFGFGRTNVIGYVTIATPGNATDFGDLTAVRNGGPNGCSDTTRGVFGGGNDGSKLNNIDYVTIATPGNATDFGDLTVAREFPSSFANSTYGVWAGGRNASNAAESTIDYITIQTTSNATDFGDTTAIMRYGSGCSGSPS